MLPPFSLALFGGILLIPAQAEQAPTLKNRGSLLSLRTSLSGLPVNFAAAGGTCDAGSVMCNDHWNCNEGETCTADGRCSGSLDDAPKCNPGTDTCGSRCIPSDAVCCEGGEYCDAGQVCVEGGSCRDGDGEKTTLSIPRATATARGTAAPTTTSASAGTTRGAYGDHVALAVGLCAAVALAI
ncbi:hypothetical protein LX36DRAFT_676622 [Colletotrichum falcatum]|nr:hypothetical protein LX36DRAFT_676622 [Colletotrichum falcatum]